MNIEYQFLPELFLRVPCYSFSGYDLERLPEVLATTLFRNTIYLASPDFYRVIEAKTFDFDRLGRKEKHTLNKYYNRMCFRPTPFGSFASFTMLEWGIGDTVRLSGDEQALLHLLPDESLLTACSNAAPPPSGEDLLVKNPTLYQLGKEYRYIKTTADTKGHYQFSIDALPGGKFLHALFFQFFKGAMTTSTLLAFIQKRSGCSAEEAQDYLTFLLAEQVIFPPSSRHIIGCGLPANLDEESASLWTPYRNIPFTQAEPLTAAAKRLYQLSPGQNQAEGEAFFYAALERRHDSGGPGEADKQALTSAIAALQKLALPLTPPNLGQFAKDFSARFDLEKVPLLKALDPDAGIAYGDNGLSGIVMAYGDLKFPEPPEKMPALDWSPVHRLLFRLWGSAQQNGPYAPLLIRPEDLSEVKAEPGIGLPPSTISLMFRKTADHLVIDYAGGAAAANSLIGRFSSFSSEVLALCRKLAELEGEVHPDLVFADIGQLSDVHSDNINRREQIYPYEIPVNVYSALPQTQQILPQDLLVSVRGGQVILESVKLNQRVMPRLATAYNHRHNGLSLFRFLADLQYQDLQAGLSFSMESFFPGLNFYPRVVFGMVIISLARWHFKGADLAVLLDAGPVHSLPGLRLFREQHGLPQMVSMGHTDQQLVFDLSCPQESLFFLQCLRGMKRITLAEYLLPGRSVKTGNEPLSGQFIAFLSHRERIYRGIAGSSPPGKIKNTRNFLPGSEWLYLKLYCTPESADRILAKVISPVLRKYKQLISAWFFIRYFENGHHLRLRVRMAPEKSGLLLAALKKQMRLSGDEPLIRNFQGDVYRREMERYGAAIIADAESFFWAGSELSMRFTILQESEKTTLTNLMLGVFSAYHLVACFLPGRELMLVFFKLMAARFLKGFGGDKGLKADLDREYRAVKNEIAALLEKQVPEKTLAAPFKKMLKKTLEIQALAGSYPLDKKQALLADLVHMQLNRTFRIKHRQQELMVYYFLEKYMLSLTARQDKAVQAG
jgi:thiopeptide-type bacteriocin biosynthesis protein